MEIVINKCFGGYGLSHEALMLYADKKNFMLYPYVEARDKSNKILPFGDRKYVPYTGQKDVWLIHYYTAPLVDGKSNDDSYFSYHDIERTDPILIEVVKELGSKANGEHAQLEVITIPDDVDYYIHEYDGIESIHEQHRSWG